MIEKIFGVSWKTSFAGYATLLCGGSELLGYIPEKFKPHVHAVCLLLVAFGLTSAKDSNVTNAAKPAEPKKVDPAIQAGFGT